METKLCCASFCKILRSKKDEIIKLWADRVKKTLEIANEQPSYILIDHLPELISSLSDILENESLEHPKKIEPKKKNELSRAHGKQRALETNYCLEEVLTEYLILRGVIIENLYKNEFIDVEAIKIVHKYLDESIQNAVLEFVKIQHTQIEEGLLNLKEEKYLRETFVSAMTHDLRTPITTARMSAQIIRKNPHNTDNVYKQISRIINNVDRIDHMIQDLLDANMIKAGKLPPISIGEYDLKNIAEETISDLIVSFGSRFILNSPAHLMFNCSQNAIRRILDNLCSNAAKYGAADSYITITIEEVRENVLIKIHNEGNVISTNDMKGLFSQYHRSSSALSSGHKGWGIGLTLVKGLVEAHSGSISVISNEQEGTVFEVQLPKTPLNP